jgi:hypothetical protein
VSETPTFSETYNFFVDEGVWLEQQIKAEGDIYKRCPLCGAMKTAFEAMIGRIATTLRACDKEVDVSPEGPEREATEALWCSRLVIERGWYETAKAVVASLFEKGHSHAVQKAHPDMKRKTSVPGTTKAQLTRNQRRNRRQAERKARKRARIHAS